MNGVKSQLLLWISRAVFTSIFLIMFFVMNILPVKFMLGISLAVGVWVTVTAVRYLLTYAMNVIQKCGRW